MREKDLLLMINKLTELKTSARTSDEILNTLEEIRETLESLQIDVNNHLIHPTIIRFFPLATE